MKSMMITLAVLFFAFNAFAIQDPDPDTIGMYFDLDANIVCWNTAGPFEAVTAYLIATNLSVDSGVSGWEAYIQLSGDAPLAANWSLIGLDVDPSPEGFQVGIGVILPIEPLPATVLATWTGFIGDPSDQISFHISGIPGSASFPDSPGYAAGDNAGDLRPLRVSAGSGLGFTAAMINAVECQVVANEDLTFSRVKALYR